LRKFAPLLLILLFFSGANATAATAPADSTYRSHATTVTGILSPGNFEKITGRRPRLRERIALAIVKRKLRRAGGEEEMTGKQKDWATTSMVLGLGSILCLFLPVLAVLSIPAAILAIIFGIKSLKGNSNTKGIIGVVAGSLVILLILAVLVWLLSGAVIF